MSDNVVNSFMSNVDEQTVRKMLKNLSDEDIRRAMEWIAEEMIVPHLEEVRDRADSQPSAAEIRDYYESMPDDQREEEFYETLDSLVAVLVECRERPTTGFQNLKAMLRDPYTTEALLLIFENKEFIDEDYTEELKQFASVHLRWVGAMVLPEMYDRSAVEDVLDTFDITDHPGDADVGR